ncbi:BaiN/RdsA family NAD(P)/FAD-dependent oxidoreductase [Numidum massiliense]|uniref:NAD(P)/FAD-dependent oxidoreductase n=1 Tax=Numidum massiliense TaxID=1522315 RepID=UPI0006D55C5E|nr:NAD(P)/FAD-dependent oxidoreductase [Numidum massiliense]
MTYDVIVIGGGPSGLMASIAAAREPGTNVLLVDKGDRLGRKLGISGGGRCNVTNAKPIDELIKNIPGNGRFLYSALATFSNADIIAFFEGLGIQLKEEDRGRMFPVSDKAKTVVQALIAKVRAQGVHIRVNSPVERVLYGKGGVQGVKLTNGERIHATCVIVASGGKSVPQTGSTGDGYAWAETAGHTVTELYPTEVPLTSDEPFIANRELQGLSLRDITLTVWNPRGKKIVTHEGDLVFTHFGLSGPTALRCSQFVVKARKTFNVPTVTLTIDLFPQHALDHLHTELSHLAKQEPKKSLKNALKRYIPERLSNVVLQQAELSLDVTCGNVAKQKWLELSQLLKAFPVRANGTLPLEKAFVTGGGVHLKEIDPKTMQSRRMPGLFFCGEILDVHGYTGGYNITAAFTTGYSAGKSAAAQCAANT